MIKISTVFLDRDGTIGGSSKVELPGEFQLYDRAKEALEILKSKGIRICSFTNQPDISRGKATIKAFEEELLQFGFDKVYICPHTHDEGCECRKPNTGMLKSAEAEYNINLKESVVIGDRWSDMLAAGRVEATMILVKTGAGKEALSRFRHKWDDYKPAFVAEDILDGIEWLINKGLI